MKNYLHLTISLIGVGLLTFAPAVSAGGAGSESGALYVMSNKANRTSVFVYARASDGSLTLLQQIGTDGLGTGVTLDPPMSQGAIALRADGKLLLAVNPASGNLTAFTVTDSVLKFGSKVPSGGAFPVSVTVSGGFVCVLNQLGEANISGFTVTDAGLLTPIGGSTRILAGGPVALPAQVSFTPDASQLLVTEKGTSLLDTFQILPDGRTTGPTAQKSMGPI